MIRFFSIFILLLVTSAAVAEIKTYGVAHIGVTVANGSSDFKIVDRSSAIGLKGVTPLNNGLYATYKFEVGVNITSQSSEDSPYLHYSFVGLKSNNIGEFRLGFQDSAYDVVDNSMENFLTEQGNGLITENDSANLVAYIKKTGPIGFYASHIPSSEDNHDASSSIMINYAEGSLYAGLGVVKEPGSEKKEGIKLVVTYKKNNYGLGLIHEKCPSKQNVVSIKSEKAGCSMSGKGHVDHFSGVYRFGRSYVSAQIARSSYLGINKHTIELGSILGKGTKAYIELDKTGGFKSTTLGLKTYF